MATLIIILSIFVYILIGFVALMELSEIDGWRSIQRLDLVLSLFWPIIWYFGGIIFLICKGMNVSEAIVIELKYASETGVKTILKGLWNIIRYNRADGKITSNETTEGEK